jgi:hypothetical protein
MSTHPYERPVTQPQAEPIAFNDRERLLLNYYRDPAAGSRHWQYDFVIGAAALLCVGVALARSDAVLGAVASFLLLGRLYYLVAEGNRYTADFQSIFSKYDAKVRELASQAPPKQSL